MIQLVIFGSGHVASDLLIKIQRSSLVELVGIVGRSEDSPGIGLARELGATFLTSGFAGLSKLLETETVDWVIDASSAEANVTVRSITKARGVRLLDLTPSPDSFPFLQGFSAPSEMAGRKHVGLVSCGAQSAFPVLTGLSELGEIAHVELTSSLSSASVGSGTRANLDAYIEKTTKALDLIAASSKVILIVNPAEPPIDMTVTMFVKFGDETLRTFQVRRRIRAMLPRLLELIPGLAFLDDPLRVGDFFQIAFRVKGAGDYLPQYAGNLDVINRAAMSILESQ